MTNFILALPFSSSNSKMSVPKVSNGFLASHPMKLGAAAGLEASTHSGQTNLDANSKAQPGACLAFRRRARLLFPEWPHARCTRSMSCLMDSFFPVGAVCKSRLLRLSARISSVSPHRVDIHQHDNKVQGGILALDVQEIVLGHALQRMVLLLPVASHCLANITAHLRIG